MVFEVDNIALKPNSIKKHQFILAKFICVDEKYGLLP